MSTTTNSQTTAPFKEFSVETEMKDVEILRVSPDRILAKGKRYGRWWLLRGLPPEKRSDSALLRQLREEFDRRFSRLEPDIPLTVGIEEIEGLGPCIVEEWREDYHDLSSMEEKDESRRPKHRQGRRSTIILLVAFIFLAGALASGSYIRRLTMSSRTAKSDLEALRAANLRSEERMFMLADSLEKVLHGPLIPEEYFSRVEIMEEDKQDRIADALCRERKKEFERELARYDRYVMPHVMEDLPVFYDSICALYSKMVDMGRDIDPYGRFPQPEEDDRIRLKLQLYGCYMSSLQDYLRVWLPNAWGAYEKKKKQNAPDSRTNKE
ncbi:MAG: hypothetical protein K2K98_09180 [Muribaculaceae bacterium]|nr:hypothetical protein [Muribaculaceae bacterium]